MASCPPSYPVDPLLVAEVAYRTWRRWRAWAERVDIEQELWAWAYARAGVDELKPHQVGSALRDVAERYCRREKAQRSGYRPQDEVFYTLPLLRELIGTIGVGITRRGVDDSNTKIARAGAAAPTMEYETMRADLAAGMATLAFEDWRLLMAVYERGESYAEVGAWLELTEEQVNNAVARAIRRLQRGMGGRRPIVI